MNALTSYRIPAALLLCLATSSALAAQAAIPDSTPAGTVSSDSVPTADARGWFSSFAYGVPVVDGEEFASFGFLMAHFASVRDGRPGLDLAVGWMPRALQFRAIVMTGQVGATLAWPVSPGVMLLPRAGVSLLGVGSEAANATWGTYVGGMANLFVEGRTGVRIGITAHRFREYGNATFLLWELGLVRDGRR